jgi:hypothetical protein
MTGETPPLRTSHTPWKSRLRRFSCPFFGSRPAAIAYHAALDMLSEVLSCHAPKGACAPGESRQKVSKAANGILLSQTTYGAKISFTDIDLRPDGPSELPVRSSKTLLRTN